MKEETKPAIRREIQQALRKSAPASRAAWSSRIVDHLSDLPRFLESRTVLLFAPLPSEPNLLPLLEAPEFSGRRWVFPRISGQDLRLHLVERTGELSPGTGNILEPTPGSRAVSAAEIDFALVPGLAFDPATGMRLGRGGGYYDRLLAKPGFRAFALGVCFSLQLRAGLPCEAHDVPVHAILTELGVA